MSYPLDGECQDCKERIWQVSLTSGYGRFYLCAPCAAYAIAQRDSKFPKLQERFSKLLLRIFKREESAHA